MLEVEPHALRDERIVEVHPEVSFRELAGREVVHSKHTAVGVEERLALLAGAGIVLPDRPRGLPLVDALDAAVAAWTAARWSRGDATPLPAGHTERIGAIWR
jgi:predicted RNase H-like nuclease